MTAIGKTLTALVAAITQDRTDIATLQAQVALDADDAEALAAAQHALGLDANGDPIPATPADVPVETPAESNPPA